MTKIAMDITIITEVLYWLCLTMNKFFIRWSVKTSLRKMHVRSVQILNLLIYKKNLTERYFVSSLRIASSFYLKLKRIYKFKFLLKTSGKLFWSFCFFWSFSWNKRELSCLNTHSLEDPLLSIFISYNLINCNFLTYK